MQKEFLNIAIYGDDFGTSPTAVYGSDFSLYMAWLRIGSTCNYYFNLWN
ncbi:hypothetical protein [Lysinibacillus sp. RS5]